MVHTPKSSLLIRFPSQWMHQKILQLQSKLSKYQSWGTLTEYFNLQTFLKRVVLIHFCVGVKIIWQNSKLFSQSINVSGKKKAKNTLALKNFSEQKDHLLLWRSLISNLNSIKVYLHLHLSNLIFPTKQFLTW